MALEKPYEALMRRDVLVRAFFFVAGTVCLALGVIGIFVPILPTTPFLLLSAAFYMRSSERMYRWLFENRYIGEYLRNYREGRGISLTTKLLAVSMLWSTISYSILFIVDHWAVRLIFVLIAAAVSAHILRLPTLKK